MLHSPSIGKTSPQTKCLNTQAAQPLAVLPDSHFLLEADAWQLLHLQAAQSPYAMPSEHAGCTELTRGKLLRSQAAQPLAALLENICRLLEAVA